MVALRPLLAALAFPVIAFMSSAHAAEPEALLLIKNHRFEPAELKVPAGQRIKLTVHNLDAVLAGELDEITGALQDAEKRKRLELQAAG